MFNFKKIGKKVLSSVLGATLAMGSFLNTQIVKAWELELDRKEYWDPYTMLSNAEFILGDGKKKEIEKLKEEFEENRKNEFMKKCCNLCNFLVDRVEIFGDVTNECKYKLEKELYESLNESEKKIYNVVKKFITDKIDDWKKLRNSVTNIVNFEEVNLNNNNKCDILKFNDGSNKEKAIIFFLLND
ncbi:MAG: hypothetical protein Q4B84_04740, partial [Clostridia bacterium]|nr:hypothetical protein [Clostridia bacterium]